MKHDGSDLLREGGITTLRITRAMPYARTDKTNDRDCQPLSFVWLGFGELNVGVR